MIDLPESDRGAIAADLLPDLTPLLDVMFMLLLFFILTANAVPYAMDVTVPKDEDRVAAAVEHPDMTAVTLLPGVAGWKINNDVYTDKDAFKRRLTAILQQKKPVIIIGDKDASMEKLLSVMALLRKHGIAAADIVMER